MGGSGTATGSDRSSGRACSALRRGCRSRSGSRTSKALRRSSWSGVVRRVVVLHSEGCGAGDADEYDQEHGGDADGRLLAVALVDLGAVGLAGAGALGEGVWVPAVGLERGAVRGGLFAWDEESGSGAAPRIRVGHPGRVGRGDLDELGAGDLPLAVGVVVRVGPGAVAHARVEVGGVRPVRGVDDRVAGQLDFVAAAAFGPGVLAVDGLDQLVV